MAGYKESIFDSNPTSFWTFDFDLNLTNNDIIVDEIANANPMTIQGDNFELERTSLVDLEPMDQAAAIFAEGEKLNGSWVNTYFEVPNTASYSFPGTGEFTVEFLYHKNRPSTIFTSGEPGRFSTVISPLINKGSLIDVYAHDYYYNNNNDGLTLTILGRSVSFISDQAFYKDNHVVCRYRVEQTDFNEWTSHVELFVNGKLAGINSATHVDTYPSTATADSWAIGGKIGGTDPVTDFNTEKMLIDQISVYSRALPDEEISNHYRKTTHYTSIIQTDLPTDYWRVNELASDLSNNLYATVGGNTGVLYGSTTKSQPGPPDLIESRSILFNEGGSAVARNLATNSHDAAFLDTGTAFTLEFWFKAGSQEKGVLFSQISPQPAWDGISVFINSKNNLQSAGNVQVGINENTFVNSIDTDPITGARINWNDGEWHYLVVVKTTSILYLYLDNELQGEVVANSALTTNPAWVNIMAAGPGELNVTGNISEIAFYNYALSNLQMLNRWSYAIRYKVEGFTYLQGVPVDATVRFYDHITGKLLGQIETTSSTGEYHFYAISNRYIDILSFIPDNNSTRYRVHGPIKPAEYDDNPIIV